jgi:peptidoglycan/LPS O-acetylase OafA/YrhL
MVAGRNGWIDALRGWAVISVVLLHLNIRVPFADSALGAALPRPIYNALFWSGYHGVVVFFVISGFLITTGIIRRWGAPRRVPLREFYALRFARIGPCLLLFIAAQSTLQAAGIAPFTSATSPTSLLATIFSALTFHLNWLEARDGYLPGAWDVLWSLSVEEAFYCVFPLACVLLPSERALTLLLFAFVVAGPFARSSPTANEIWADHSYLSCAGEISMGCLAALLLHRAPAIRRGAKAWLALGLCLTTFVLFFRRTALAWGLSTSGLNVTLLALGAACLLIASEASPISMARGPIARFFQWFGRNSYEVYLSHLFLLLPAVALFQKLGRPSSAIAPLYLLTLLGAGGLGTLLARYYSVPSNVWLRARFQRAPTIASGVRHPG